MGNVPENDSQHPIARLRAFMGLIARQVNTDFARRRERRPEMVPLGGTRGEDDEEDGIALEESLMNAEANPAEDVLAHHERVALRRMVRRALATARLSSQQWAIMRCKYVEELSNVDIAGILRTTAGNVGVQLDEVRKKLRRSMEILRLQDTDVDQLLTDFLSRWRDA
jgi:RNA polymerase sigma factor (sigma-70 family)